MPSACSTFNATVAGPVDSVAPHEFRVRTVMSGLGMDALLFVERTSAEVAIVAVVDDW